MIRPRRSLHWPFLRVCLAVVTRQCGRGSVFVIGAFRGDTASRDLDTGLFDDLPQSMAPAAEGADLNWLGDASVTVDDPSATLAILSVLPMCLAAVAAFTVAFLLFRILLDVELGAACRSRAAAAPRRLSPSSVAGVLVPVTSALADLRFLERAAAPASSFARACRVPRGPGRGRHLGCSQPRSSRRSPRPSPRVGGSPSTPRAWSDAGRLSHIGRLPPRRSSWRRAG